jgi:uncharacterized glyoxalase superfamily protein PhnB
MATALAFATACGGATEPAARQNPAEQAASQAGAQATKVKPQPEGFFTLTPSLVVAGDVDAAVDFYVKALGATRHYSLPGPDGKTFHAEIQLGDSIVMLGPESAQMGTRSPATLGGSPGSLIYYVEDADAAWARALAAGAKQAMPLGDQFWGDRYGIVTDPSGHRWAIATHKEDLSKEQLMERARVAFGGGKGAKKAAGPPAPGTPATSYKPAGFHSLTPGIVVKDGSATIEFYKKALGAEERARMPGPDGKIMYAELAIGDSILIVNDEYPDMGARSPASLGGTPLALMVYVPDVDTAFGNAVKAGARAKQEPADMFWGDRYGELTDPSGHLWGLATHKEDLTPEQIAERMKAYFSASQGAPQ